MLSFQDLGFFLNAEAQMSYRHAAACVKLRDKERASIIKKSWDERIFNFKIAIAFF